METNTLTQDNRSQVSTSLSEKEIEEISADLRSIEQDIRISALMKVIQIPHDKFMPILLEISKEDLTPHILYAFVKAIGVVGGVHSFPLIAKYLKHPSGRVRANCIEAIQLSGAGNEKYQVTKILLRFLSDPDRRVVGNCLNALALFLSQDEIALSVNDYFDVRDEHSCLNCLFLISQLGLSQNTFIFEACLTHSSEKVRDYAQKLFPLFEKKNPEVRKLLLRKPGNQALSNALSKAPAESVKFVDFLMDRMSGGNTREKIDVLQEVGSESHWQEDPRILSFLKHHIAKEEEPFVLATLVKTIARLSKGDEWETLSPLLHHEDSRVVSNTVESLVFLGDERILKFLDELLEEADLEKREHVRTLSAGMELIKKSSPRKALELLKRLSQGNVTAVAAFIHHLKQWDKPSEELVDSVIELTAKEVRPDILFECANFLSKYSSGRVIPIIEDLVSQMDAGEKYEILRKLQVHLEERFPQSDDQEKSPDAKGVRTKVISSAQARVSEKLGTKPLKSFEPLMIESVPVDRGNLFQSPWFWFFILTMLVIGLGALFVQSLLPAPTSPV